MTNTNTIYEKIRQFYDQSSGLWEQVWGEHMHHGYYGRSGSYKVNRRQAQIDLIEELLYWGQVQSPQRILDVGCGIGGSTLYLAQKYNTEAVGITLSPIQAARAKERALEVKLDQKASFQVANALEMPFPDDSFDLVWSLESGEHMPDKAEFFRQCYRVLKPGGLFLCATWCHRPTNSLAGELTVGEQQHLDAIYRVYCLPYVMALPDYEAIAKDCGFRDIHSDDWSTAVAPFWDIVIDSALNPKVLADLFASGWSTVEAALALPLMSQGYKRGLVRFGVLSGRK
ncbi:methyltransferase domain-containing protein [Spirulina subsalsa FACHB-351]|uniref:Methyltransferase domain-containing protein n=1 Tax=Spirulina subsalsa FACHB-351 TaxID=234711 RepID=A0ABT3LCN3_9CYAN|nr:methyltransferase domain-containing protein [Spirulina subsalsa]MCW6038740.1 methyltransferase domain-containing protein [Spirulina subsalsa FACHB-351]